MKLLYIFLFFISSCFAASNSRREKARCKAEYLSAKSENKIDSIFFKNGIEVLDSAKFVSLLLTEEQPIITHSINPYCSFTYEVIEQIMDLDSCNCKYLPIFIITEPEDLNYSKLATIRNKVNIKFYYLDTKIFNYFNYLKKRYNIKNSNFLFIIDKGRLVANVDEINKDIRKMFCQ